MHRRSVVALALVALAPLLAACSSDDDSSPSEESSTSAAPLDLSGVEVEAVCTDLGAVYDWMVGAQEYSSDVAGLREYFATETPAAIEHVNAAAAASDGELATALEQMAETYQANFDESQSLSDEEFAASLLSPEPDAELDEAIVVVNRFTDPECGFRFTTV